MASPDELRFLQWLQDNGATFPKLQWPVATPNGLRGAVATEDIATNEPMLSIPRHLLISEEMCWQDPQLGPVFRSNRDVFTRDDPVMALFIVRELLLEQRSFFHPYLAILPSPESVQDWTHDELRELHDERLVGAAVRRSSEINIYYRRVMTRLQEKYAGEFPETLYTFDKFKFAWKTIQARTFGRRLPWTALVPLADCLNHNTVATKYDFDVNGSGLFRLYPSATTSFAKDSEVFNSYGRRSNFQLLLDYGFALTDNEWDYVDVEIGKDRAGPWRLMKQVIRIDRQSSLEEILPPNFLADTTPNGNQNEAAAACTEVSTLCDALQWLRGILTETIAEWGVAEHDQHLLIQQEGASDRLRAAITYRTGRRQIVLGVLTQIDKKLDITKRSKSFACD
ncbi:SET domain-containing protein [Phytophthora infestans]|uniref:SET domain-containing protein n=1 Tax=Phytophthora infestans TaxID=4787 RepID=A0A833WJK7_PHYIN|nr:SET domain-containing protein [Phytophthora infestans]KAF4131300.1 SET domain-containing protein [Phytophthora infestans]